MIAVAAIIAVGLLGMIAGIVAVVSAANFAKQHALDVSRDEEPAAWSDVLERLDREQIEKDDTPPNEIREPTIDIQALLSQFRPRSGPRA
jgi:hypothetical protein